MEAVKKKLAQLKDEKEVAIERAEEAEKAKKEAEERADQVRERVLITAHVHFRLLLVRGKIAL